MRIVLAETRYKERRISEYVDGARDALGAKGNDCEHEPRILRLSEFR